MDPSSLETQGGLSTSCEKADPQEDLQINGSTPQGVELSIELKDDNTFEATYGDQGNPLKDLSSVVEKLPTDLQSVTKPDIVGKKSHVQGSLSLKQAARQSHQRSDSKHLGKRVGTQSEKNTSNKKRLKVSPLEHQKRGSKVPPISVSDEAPTDQKFKAAYKKEVGSLTGEVDAAPVVSSIEPPMLSRAVPKLQARDISKEEAAFEFQQCVSLLRKYGILNTPEYYLSQKFPHCAPHPGFVGDKHLSKRCKICRVLEDTNSTVICDECQEPFHLSCCLPRLNPKHFDKEDDWYCSSCRKQKRRMGRYCDGAHTDGSGDPASMTFISKVKLGSAYQANVPQWTGETDKGCPGYVFGMEEPLSEEAKENEKTRLLEEFELMAQKWRKQVTNNSIDGAPENWLKCQGVLVKGLKDCDGHKNTEIICGKWRRAPLNIQQFERWECFCAIEWDPFHADCAVPQELPTEEVLLRMQERQDLQQIEYPKHVGKSQASNY